MKIRIIGVPQDLGAARRGVDMGPSAIRLARLQSRLQELGHQVTDAGNIPCFTPESFGYGDSKVRYLKEVRNNCELLAGEVEKAAGEGYFPLVLGGDHSIAIGTVSGLGRSRGRLGIIWMDAHGDFNTPDTSPSGNIHGMSLAAIAGLGDRALTHLDGSRCNVRPENIALIGVRDLDPGERRNIRESGIKVFTMSDIDSRGIKAVVEEAIESAAAGTDNVHLSIDMDIIDPEEAPGTGSPVPGGITYREAHLAMEIMAEWNAIGSMEVVEVNPILDTGNKTGELAVSLILSALGKRII